MACKPQIPGQGSTHCWFTQDLSNAHWALIIHSGWQSGGAPKYPGKHEQTGWFSKTWHSLYKPHGDGRHGLSFGIGKYAFRKMTIRNQWKKFDKINVYFPTMCLTIVRNWIAAKECISGVIGYAITHRWMINDRAFSVHTTRIFTWIDTLGIDTSKITWTIKTL